MPLTTAQLQTLKAAIAAETDPTFVTYRTNGQTGQMAGFYNGNSTFVVWRTNVSIRETGQVFDGAEWAGMTSANHTRLQTVAQYLMAYNAGVAGIRAMFNDIWSGAGGTNTRASLLVLWKRFATKGERLYVTGTGTDVTPGLLVFEGSITDTDISAALAL
jgi:hypothetical protein